MVKNEANINRLGGFGSDLFSDYRQNLFDALADRGPGGGVIPFAYLNRVLKIRAKIPDKSVRVRYLLEKNSQFDAIALL